MKKCLIIIDVQNGFLSSKTKYVLPQLESLVSSFSEGLIVATKFINPGDNAFNRILHWKRLQTAPETDLAPFVLANADFVVEKRIYSGCSEELVEMLEREQIREVLLAGIDTDCCVLKTAIDLFEHNIRPVVLADYCASNGGMESHLAALRVLERTIGKRQIFRGSYPQGAGEHMPN